MSKNGNLPGVSGNWGEGSLLLMELGGGGGALENLSRERGSKQKRLVFPTLVFGVGISF